MKLYQILAGVIILCSSSAHAALLSVTPGSTTAAGTAAPAAIIAAPQNALDDAATNSGMQGFDEVQNFVTTVDHAVDGGGVIAAGTRVDSHMIFLNSAGGTLLEHFNVEWTFSGNILGVMSDSRGELEAASTFELGNPGTNYTTVFAGSGPAAPFAARGLESINDPTTNTDGYAMLGALNVLTVAMRVTEPGDWIRVITAASVVPVPAAVWLFGTALVGFIGFSRRRIVA